MTTAQKRRSHLTEPRPTDHLSRNGARHTEPMTPCPLPRTFFLRSTIDQETLVVSPPHLTGFHAHPTSERARSRCQQTDPSTRLPARELRFEKKPAAIPVPAHERLAKRTRTWYSTSHLITCLHTEKITPRVQRFFYASFQGKARSDLQDRVGNVALAADEVFGDRVLGWCLESRLGVYSAADSD